MIGLRGLSGVGLERRQSFGIDYAAAILALSPIVWIDQSAASSMSVGTDGTGGVPGADDPVGRVTDRSGNDRHLVAEDDASRPALKSHNGVAMLQYATDDTMAVDVSGATMSDVSVICLTKIPASDTSFIIYNAGDGASSSFAACGADGSASGAHTTAVGATYAVDGSDLGGTARSDLFTGLADDSIHIFEMRGADLSGLGWTVIEISGFSTDAGSFRLDGSSISNLLIMDTTTYDANRSSVILPYYSQISGVTA